MSARLDGVNLWGFSALRGGLSLAMMTAIHGSGTDSRMSPSASYQTFANNTASTMQGIRMLIMRA